MSLRDLRTLYAAIDIERTGVRFCDQTLAIGVVVGWGDGRVVAQRCFASAVPCDAAFEPACLAEFWHAPKDDKRALLRRIDAAARRADGSARSELDMVHEFVDFMRALHARYGPFGRGQKRRFELLSDNPDFDIGSIDRLMERAGYATPLRHIFAGYVCVGDPSEARKALAEHERRWVSAQVTAAHDHWPVNDALCIYQQQLAVSALVECRHAALAYQQLCSTHADARQERCGSLI